MTWRHFKAYPTRVESSPVSTAMDSATFSSMQGKKNPICARERNDPRIQRFRMMDGKEQVQQKLYHEKLFEEGRRASKNPKPKGTEEGPLPGMYAAMAHFDALAAKKPAAVLDGCRFLCCQSDEPRATSHAPDLRSDEPRVRALTDET